MAQVLPESEEEMLKIPHVTKANFVKYGDALLEVTKEAAARRNGNNVSLLLVLEILLLSS